MDFKLNKGNLNFRVYTATAVPITGAENDICVISSVPMKNWILSPDEPSGAPKTDGDVWITYSTSGNVLNILKQDSMMIAPISAKQYISGAWVDQTVKSYQNGAWVDWVTFLYNNGDECLDFSGGFNTYGYRISGSSSSIKAPTLTKDETSMTIAETSTSAYAGAVFHENPFKVDDFSKITVVSSGKTGDKSPQLGVSKTKATGFVLESAVMYLPTEGTAEIDISTLSGEYYFVVSLAGDYKKAVTIHKIYLS